MIFYFYFLIILLFNYFLKIIDGFKDRNIIGHAIIINVIKIICKSMKSQCAPERLSEIT